MEATRLRGAWTGFFRLRACPLPGKSSQHLDCLPNAAEARLSVVSRAARLPFTDGPSMFIRSARVGGL